MQLFYVPCKDHEEARKIAQLLLKEKLVFCANIIPAVESYFLEADMIVSCNEVILLLKTSSDVPTVIARIKQLHSYKIPAIINFSAEANLEFLKVMHLSTAIK